MKLYENNIFYYILLIVFIYIFGSLFYTSSFGPGDDLVFLQIFENGNFFQLLNDFFLSKTHLFERPISVFFIGLIHFVFEKNLQLYLLLFFVSFLLTNFLIYKSLKSLINQRILKTFLILSLTPFLTSSYLQSPYLLAEFILPVLFWSVSFYFLTFSLKNKKEFFLLSNFFLLISLFCTVISFPLFILNLFLPLIYWRKNFSLNKYFFKIFFPLIIVFLIYLGYLKFINFLFNSPTYGSSSLSLDSFLQGVYFFFTIFIEFPIMIVKSLLFSNFFQFLFILILVSVFFILLKKESVKKNYMFDRHDNKLFLIILFLSLSVNFLIFFLSGYPSVTYGYYNRMLISAFISLTLILAILLNLKHNLFFLILKIVLVTLILNSSKVITNQIVEIDLLKKKEISLLSSSLKSYNSQNSKKVLVAKLPLYLDNNYNNLEVFWLTWDLAAILKNENLNFFQSFPISDQVLKFEGYHPSVNFFNHLDILREENITSYIFVENGKILEFQTLGFFLNFLEAKKKIDVKLIYRETFRSKLKDFIKSFT